MFEKTQPKTAKSPRTFERVLAAATRLFCEKGFAATTMRDISKASELGLGALYYYFRSKEEIVLCFYERINDQVRAEFEAQRRGLSLQDALEAYMRLKIKTLEPYRPLLKVVLKEAIDPESQLSPLHGASAPTLQANLAVFEALLKEGKVQDAPAVARALWLAHLGVLTFWLHDRSAHQRATHAVVKTFATAVSWSSTLAMIPGLSRFRQEVLHHVGSVFAGHPTA